MKDLKMILKYNNLDINISINDFDNICINILQNDLELYSSSVNDFEDIRPEVESMISFLIEMGDIDDPMEEYMNKIVQED